MKPEVAFFIGLAIGLAGLDVARISVDWQVALLVLACGLAWTAQPWIANLRARRAARQA